MGLMASQWIWEGEKLRGDVLRVRWVSCVLCERIIFIFILGNKNDAGLSVRYRKSCFV